MASSSASGPRASGLPGLLFRFPPLYSVEQYIVQQGARHDFLGLVALLNYPGRLSVLHNIHAGDTVATLGVKGGSTGRGRF